MKRLILIDDGAGINNVIGQVFDSVVKFKDVQNVNKHDTFLFTGGEDVSPDFYGEKKHPTTYNNRSRDIYEQNVFTVAQSNGASCIGICRGSQFLTVMNGGKLIQNVNNHAIGGTHSITTYDGKELVITSTHHQMHYPYNLSPDEYKLLAWSTEQRSRGYDGNPAGLIEPPLESEILWFPKTRSLCIQGHPEYMGVKHETCEYIRDLITKFIFNKEN